ncbi:MAG: tetratricopeptide repeat protein [Desulfobacteraceae bacterium]
MNPMHSTIDEKRCSPEPVLRLTWLRVAAIVLLIMVTSGCGAMGEKGTIGGLRHRTIKIEKAEIEGGLDKAMESYRRFLEETPDSALSPEAIRRLADLKIEKEYGTLTDGQRPVRSATAGLEAPNTGTPVKTMPIGGAEGSEDKNRPAPAPLKDKADAEFEKQATRSRPLPETAAEPLPGTEGGDDLAKAGPLEAIELYNRLLSKYPLYDRNDQVLYQMSRAYEELGRIDEAMAVTERLVREYPNSRYIDEVQFRRAEFFFTRRKYLDAEDAYKSIVRIGPGSYYYELALYKLGWTFYKQELYEEAQHRFIALLDHKVSIGYDFDQTEDEQERKRTADTFRVISLGFSNLGGAQSVVDFFEQNGSRSYENNVYQNLAEFYFDKRRYADAAASYTAFVERNPFHKKSPNFHMRIIEIHTAGGFPTLVLEAKKSFASTYGLHAEYWRYFDPKDRPDVISLLKTNLTDLANHYHASYQKPRKPADKPGHFKEALHWYREFLVSFPKEPESPGINFQMADLLLQNKSYAQAAVEYEKTAYQYPDHAKSSEAGYAAVYSHRKHLETATKETKEAVKRDVVRSSMAFVEKFPKHEKAAIVLGAAAEDLYTMQEFEKALAAGTRLIEQYPGAEKDIVRTAWLVRAHSSYELQHYGEAEKGYAQVLALLPAGDKSREGLVDNLAAAIYKQGEEANAAQDYQAAADHFLRVGRMAPTSKIRVNAEYDAAVALIQLKEWKRAAVVLTGFRKMFPKHELLPEVTKKIAYVYKEDGQLSMAAREFERIETESGDESIRKDALLTAAELYEQAKDQAGALTVYRRYVGYFPKPVDVHLETRNKIANILKAKNDRPAYLEELRQIVAIDAAAGKERTPRTRYLAGMGALVLAENDFADFKAVRLVRPVKRSLKKKQKLMKKNIRSFNKLLDYEMGEVTAAATFYLAEIYTHFSKALMNSERPVLTFDVHKVQPGETLSGIAKQYEADIGRIARENNLNKSRVIVAGKKLKIPRGLNPLELEQYELALEEQAYPFEEKGIEVHESNLKLIGQGVYNEWIDKSLQKLAVFMPARYAKPEERSGIVASLESYLYAIERPAPPEAAASGPGAEGSTAAPSEEPDGPLENPGAANSPQVGKAPETASEPPSPVAGVGQNPPEKPKEEVPNATAQ